MQRALQSLEIHYLYKISSHINISLETSSAILLNKIINMDIKELISTFYN